MHLNLIISNDVLILPKQPLFPFPGITKSLPKFLQSFTQFLKLPSDNINIGQYGELTNFGQQDAFCILQYHLVDTARKQPRWQN